MTKRISRPAHRHRRSLCVAFIIESGRRGILCGPMAASGNVHPRTPASQVGSERVERRAEDVEAPWLAGVARMTAVEAEAAVAPVRGRSRGRSTDARHSGAVESGLEAGVGASGAPEERRVDPGAAAPGPGPGHAPALAQLLAEASVQEARAVLARGPVAAHGRRARARARARGPRGPRAGAGVHPGGAGGAGAAAAPRFGSPCRCPGRGRHPGRHPPTTSSATRRRWGANMSGMACLQLSGGLDRQ